MRQNTQPEKQSLTPMQKQAVLVCIVCALAALLTIGITLVLIHRGKEPAASSEQPGTEQPADDANIADHYQINEQSSALLPETADAGDAYQNETLFIGDSNTVRLYANGLISLQQFCAKEGIGTHAALNEGIVTFKKDSSRYTIAEAVAKMKPRRVVIMLGTNDTGMAVEDFISNYKQLVQAIQTSYLYTDIIVNTVPPVPADHSNYPNMDQTRIDDFNMALLSMCEEMGLKFLNTAEALKDSTGYGNADYYQSGDIHLKTSGLKVLLNYLRTHAYETEDRRPDTNNIPSRAEYVPDRKDHTDLQRRCKPVGQRHGGPGIGPCVRQVERRRDQQDPHRCQLQAESGCDRRVCCRLGADQQQRQGCSGRQLHLPREDQRQASGGRFHPLVCQRCGGCFCRRPDQRDGAHYS